MPLRAVGEKLMRNIWTMTKREFNMYFASPVAYFIIFGYLFVLGLIFAITLYFGMQGGRADINQVLAWFVYLSMFSGAGVTMRLLAEEQRTGTMELLLTAPLREWELVVGKWLAAVGFMCVTLSFTLVYAIILNQYTDPGIDLGALMAAYLGLVLFTGATLAIGVFVSSLFSNQIAAFFLTTGIFLGINWLVGVPFQNSTGAVATVMQYLGAFDHYFNNFQAGAVVVSDVVYFVSVMVLFLFLATRVVESRRWR